jgi:hypothetical protein
MSNNNGEKSFWRTLPGILTGIAAVISAIGGLILALNAAGIITISPVTPTPTPTPLIPTPTTTPTTGSISVSSSPSGASIYLDGSYKGTTPMTIKNVEAGSYTITLKYAGYQDWSQNIYVVAEQTIPVSASLTPTTPTTGSISVSSSPSGASIYLDGSYKGITPMTMRSIEVGSYTITLKYTGYQDWSQIISVRAGDTTYVSPPLTPQAPQMTIRIKVVTGTDGTNDKPILKLYDKQGSVAAQFTMDKSNALRPGQTDEFTFTSSLTFCDLTGFQIIKPAGPTGDDPWDLREEYIYIDNVLVFFSTTTGIDFSPVTSTSFPPNGGWDGTNEYKQRCGG